MNARRTEPTRHLHGQHKGTKPHKYVPAVETNIAETFARFRRLQAMQRAQQEQTK